MLIKCLICVLSFQQVLTDVTLSCNGHFYPAHRLILTLCSDYFAKTFQMIESSTSVVLLHGISHTILEAILSFVYDGKVIIIILICSDF